MSSNSFWKDISRLPDVRMRQETIAGLLHIIADQIEKRGAQKDDLDPGETSDWIRNEARSILESVEKEKDCCKMWSRIRKELHWFRFEDEPQVRVMPCLGGAYPGSIRVNYCPSCGAYVRSITWDTMRQP